MTNGEHLQRLLAGSRGREDRGIEALVKHRFITGRSLVQSGEPAKLSESPDCAAPHAPALGGNLALGSSSVRAFWVTALTWSFIKAWERVVLKGSPLNWLQLRLEKWKRFGQDRKAMNNQSVSREYSYFQAWINVPLDKHTTAGKSLEEPAS